MDEGKIIVGLMGLGTVGGGVATILSKKKNLIEKQVGSPVEIKRILVRDLNKRRPAAVAPNLLTVNAQDILGDPQTDIVVEVIGGQEPAYTYLREALRSGKHVVTANKEVMGKYGPELLALADQQHLGILYEASVGGGIPLIAPFQQDLAANEISSIQAIINGTTNYILSRMAKEGTSFSNALTEAQEKGYAESDPSKDIGGMDAAYKLAILSTLAFHTPVRPDDVYCEGIAHLTPKDFKYAGEMGYAIKLLAIAREKDKKVGVRVHPALLPEHLLLAKVDGVFNAVCVEGDLVGTVLFYGRGAGAWPTSSAVVADLIALARGIRSGVINGFTLWSSAEKQVVSISQLITRYYLRIDVADRPGVLAQIASILGDCDISIASCIQKEVNDAAQTAEIVIMTHLALESAMQEALSRIKALTVVKEVGSFLRVEG